VYLIIVDDDHDDCALVQSFFESLDWHHHVKTLTEPDSLFSLLGAVPSPSLLPTVIVLDYNMPRLGGQTLLMLLKRDARYKNIAVVMLSTSMTKRKEGELLHLGAHFCRQKPNTIAGMHQLLAELQAFALSLRLNNAAASESLPQE
jgi:CheY-like chemotaxis protein